MCEALTYLLDYIYIKFGANYRQIVGILTYCAPLIADLFLLRYEKDFMVCLSDNKEVEHGRLVTDTLSGLS